MREELRVARRTDRQEKTIGIKRNSINFEKLEFILKFYKKFFIFGIERMKTFSNQDV